MLAKRVIPCLDVMNGRVVRGAVCRLMRCRRPGRAASYIQPGTRR